MVTTAYACMIFAAFLPLIAAGLSKFGPADEASAKTGQYDNHYPRQWLAKQTGLRARAYNAQANTFEALPFFYAGVIVAVLMQAPQARIDTLAVIFIVARLAYLACYLANWAAFRSIVWFIGFTSVVALFFQGSI